VTSPIGAGNRLFVVEQTGLVRMILNGRTQATPSLDIRSLVKDDNEAGLHSIEFNVGFANSPYVFVAYSSKGSYLTVARYHPKSPTAATVDHASRTTVIAIPHPTYTNQWGGQLVYSGFDGTLLISTGDGGGTGDPRKNAQNNSQLLGQVLRIDPWHRCGNAAGYTGPTLTVAHPDAEALIGGYVYRGSALPLAGHYIFGDYITGNVWDHSGGVRRLQPQNVPQLTSIGQGPNRELFASAYTGRIYRMTYG
jgi:hypothetical protein